MQEPTEVKEEIEQKEAEAPVTEEVVEAPVTEEAPQEVEAVEEVIEDDGEEEAEEKFKEAEKRNTFVPPAPPIQNQPVQTNQWVEPPPAEKRWHTDAELDAIVADKPELESAAIRHKIDRENYYSGLRVKEELRIEYLTQEELKKIASKYPQIMNQNSRLYQSASRLYQTDPLLDRNNRDVRWVQAVRSAISDMVDGQIIQARNKGRGEALKERKIVGQVNLSKQTPPLREQKKAEPVLSAEEESHRQSLGWTKEQWAASRDKMAATKPRFVSK